MVFKFHVVELEKYRYPTAQMKDSSHLLKAIHSQKTLLSDLMKRLQRSRPQNNHKHRTEKPREISVHRSHVETDTTTTPIETHLKKLSVSAKQKESKSTPKKPIRSDKPKTKKPIRSDKPKTRNEAESKGPVVLGKSGYSSTYDKTIRRKALKKAVNMYGVKKVIEKLNLLAKQYKKRNPKVSTVYKTDIKFLSVCS